MTKKQFRDLVRQYLEARNHPLNDVILMVMVDGIATPSEYSDDKAYELACNIIAVHETSPNGEDRDMERWKQRFEEEKAKPRPKVKLKKGWW